MKRLLPLLLCLFMLLGCSGKIIIQDEGVKTVRREDFFDLRLVVRGVKFNVYVDENTGVLYAGNCYNDINPIMEPDGTCLTLEKMEIKEMGYSKKSLRSKK